MFTCRHAGPVGRSDTVFVGLRGPQLPFGHGGPTVVGVRASDGAPTLRRHPDARVLVDDFEWGYEARARARSPRRSWPTGGFNPEPEVSRTFARQVVSRLESEFELPGHEVDAWVARRLATGRR